MRLRDLRWCAGLLYCPHASEYMQLALLVLLICCFSQQVSVVVRFILQRHVRTCVRAV